MRAALGCAVGFALLSGAAINPRGYARRVAFLVGPASQSWAAYAKTARGLASMARDSILAAPHFTSWPVAAAALAGAVGAVVLARRRGLAGASELLPLIAAISYTLLFTLGARRAEDRFLLPQAVFVLPYAARVTGWFQAAPRVVRAGGFVAAFLAAAVALLGVASMDATLIADSRYEAERFLERMPAGARVEVYGGPIFLPRIPPKLDASRPGIEPPSERQHIPGVVEIVDPNMDPRPRAPAAIVLATELSDVRSTEPPAAKLAFALAQYRDARSHALFRALNDGSYGFVRVLRASCSVPWPLTCRPVHASTAREVWIYGPAGHE
jgi:hypothetical protein